MGKWDHLLPWDRQVRTAIEAGNFQAALEALVQGYQDVVVGYCVHVLGDRREGEEVAQNVFLAAYDALTRFEQRALVLTWVLAIARNQCWKHMGYRERWSRLFRSERDAISEALYANSSPSLEMGRLEAEQDELTMQRLALFSQSLRRLNRRERDILMMRYVFDCSFADIAKKHWRAETTVRRWVLQAEEKLKRIIAEEGVGRDT